MNTKVSIKPQFYVGNLGKKIVCLPYFFVSLLLFLSFLSYIFLRVPIFFFFAKCQEMIFRYLRAVTVNCAPI